MKKLLLVFITVNFIAQICYGQKSNKAAIRGKVFSENSKASLEAATVAIYTIDTILISYGLTDELGGFKIPGIPKNSEYRIVITHTGHKTFRKIIRLNGPLNMGDIYLATSATDLQEVIVTAERPPVIFRNDTLEFDAKAFKTLPGAVLEDLLKKLPGVDLDNDGSFYVRGRPVNRILVDGKLFFGGQSNIALKNLPSDIVDKVQVTDDQEQVRRNPEIKPADIGQVVNITLKNGIRKGAFGRAYGGIDLESNHYETGGIGNFFKDTLQVSVVAYANNVNKPGFELGDIQTIGGFNRNSNSTNVSMTGTGYAINGLSLGATGNGIQQSKGAGINHNNQFGDFLKLNFLYFYGSIESDIQRLSKRSQFIGDSVLSSIDNSYQNGRDQYHRVSAAVEWQLDSSTLISFSPYLNLRKNDVWHQNNQSTIGGIGTPINSSTGSGSSRSQDNSYAHNFSLNKSFKNRYRMFHVNHSVSVSNGQFGQNNTSASYFFEEGIIDDSIMINQFRERPSKNLNINTNAYYAEPLSKVLSVTLAGSLSLFRNRQEIDVFEWNNQSKKYDVYLDEFSSSLKRNGIRANITPGISLRFKNLLLSGGLDFNLIKIDNEISKNGNIKQSYFYKFPQLTLNWKRINISYQPVVMEPQAFDLQTVIDNSNPLFQRFGNPNLTPSINHRISLSYFNYDFKRQRQLHIFASGGVTENAIIRERYINSDGIQISRPVNANGIKTLTISGSAGYNYKLSGKVRLRIKPSLTFTYSENILLLNNVKSRYSNWGLIPGTQLVISWNDRIEVSPRYSLSFRKTNRQQSALVRNELFMHNAESIFSIRPLKRVIFEGTVSYRFNPEVSAGIPKSVTIINAGISVMAFKDRALAKLSVNDLLNQNVTVSRYASENFIYETSTNSLQRYVMITIQYNLRTFKK